MCSFVSRRKLALISDSKQISSSRMAAASLRKNESASEQNPAWPFPPISSEAELWMKRTREEAVVDERTRASCRGLFTKSLGNDKLASLIEAAHFAQTSARQYTSSARALNANLLRNSEIREKVISGSISPSELVSMTWKELSTNEQRRKDSKTEEKLIRQVTLNEGAHLLGEDKCSRCGSGSCETLDKGRRDVGKSETWGAKGDEGRGRIISCLQCHHQWEDLGLSSLG